MQILYTGMPYQVLAYRDDKLTHVTHFTMRRCASTVYAVALQCLFVCLSVTTKMIKP